MKVAVTCSHCGTIALTRMNAEGLVMLSNCEKCSNIDHWKIHAGAESLVPAYDLYERYLQHHDKRKIPSIQHRNSILVQ